MKDKKDLIVLDIADLYERGIKEVGISFEFDDEDQEQKGGDD